MGHGPVNFAGVEGARAIPARRAAGERTKRDTPRAGGREICIVLRSPRDTSAVESAGARPPSPQIHMQRVLRLARVLPALSLMLAPRLMAQTKPTIEQFMSPASPIEITSARNADRVA